MHEIRKIVKFSLLTIVVGLLMGVASAAFLKSLEIVTEIRSENPWLFVTIPVVGVLTTFFYSRYGNGAQKGNNLIIESVHQDIHVPFRMTVMTFVFTVLTHLSGGSAGREGTAVQIGGALSHRLGSLIKNDKAEQRILVMSGISAGFGSVFGTPLAGAFFGLEMCFVGKLSYEALLPCFITSFIADAVTTSLGITHASHSILAVPSLTPYIFGVTLLASLAFGAVGKYFSIAVHAVKLIYARYFKNQLVRAGVAGLIVLLAMFLFKWTAYSGLSTWMIDAGFSGDARIIDPIAKFALTVLTLGAGFQGGEATPLFDIGASLGSVIGQMSHIEPSLLAALGLIAVFGSAANTPITTIILGIEMFGVQAIPYYVIAGLVSYYLSGHHGIYTAQKIATAKRKALHSQAGSSIDSVRKTEGFHWPNIFK